MRDELAAEFAEGTKLTESEMKVLSLIWSTEPMEFFDLCNALRPHNMCPTKGDKAGWGMLFRTIGELQSRKLVNCIRNKNTKNIEQLQLTKDGANLVRSFADNNRELFRNLPVETESEDYEEWDSNKYQFSKERPF